MEVVSSRHGRVVVGRPRHRRREQQRRAAGGWPFGAAGPRQPIGFEITPADLSRDGVAAGRKALPQPDLGPDLQGTGVSAR